MYVIIVYYIVDDYTYCFLVNTHYDCISKEMLFYPAVVAPWPRECLGH